MQSLRELYKIGRGPSSSHTMGPERAAKDFLSRYPAAAGYRVVLYGSLARTGRGHLTDRALLSVLPEDRTQIRFDCSDRPLEHPNTLEIAAVGAQGETLGSVVYLSVGGGTIREAGVPAAQADEMYPFRNFAEIRAYCERERIGLGNVAFRFEDAGFEAYLVSVWESMKETVERGLCREGLLPGKLRMERKAPTLYRSFYRDRKDDKRLICSYAYATAEENASGGVVVTAPTCGASGVLPAVLLYLQNKHDLSDDTVLGALAAAGMVGNVVKTNASVSGAEAGCQAEIGTATSMAAAAVCSIFGQSLETTEYAAEIALEHQLGLTCDPVCGYVQIPCIERNAVAALRALDSADLAEVLSGTRKISFDLIVKTMYETGRDLDARYRETGEGGLASGYKIC
ncbi:MAG TPA: L-serine ammonia-lyase, iron-sulfur-dependent, subunit alpha [Firmicutes bacterium]|nr:L-serine ammonia-lyase, iron-sulfur-dependent, subunit alpha [Bacillota bacterium]